MNAVERAQLQRGLVLLREGERSAFDGVFSTLSPLFLAIANRQATPDAPDIAQEALFKLFSRIGEFDPERDALAWALGIVANEVRTARKRCQRRHEEADAVTASSASNAANPEDDLIARDLADAALQALGELRPADAEILMRAARGEREPTATFRKRLERALARLRLVWSESHGVD